MKMLIALTLAGAMLQSAQPAPKPPVLTDAQKLAFFKAQSEYLAAESRVRVTQTEADIHQKVLASAIQAITDACGKDFAPTMDAAGNPVCGPKDVKK